MWFGSTSMRCRSKSSTSIKVLGKWPAAQVLADWFTTDHFQTRWFIATRPHLALRLARLSCSSDACPGGAWVGGARVSASVVHHGPCWE